MTNKIDWQRIAFWAKQPVFDRDGDGLLDVPARVVRLKAMHDEFGTIPVECLGDHRFQCESRVELWKVFQCAN